MSIENVEPTDKLRSWLEMRQKCGDSIRPEGFVQVWMNGELYSEQANIVVDNGHELAAHRFRGDGTVPDALSHIAIGTGTQSFTAARTALQTEVNRQAIDSHTRSGNVITMTVNFAGGEGTGTITEAGCFNASSSGTMFARSEISPARVKGSNDTLDITWTITF